ncbi:hypothetical protein [Flavobacterium sp.]|uniref:hypothetical protein n=1 Tax=Flavobacterium sp. TaxID=239 RepID=UPI001B5BD1DA|nr:hypothetical protein [Flavobacterium sp.]MBP6181944.1 hypothetical protein [Flavobacterium sp.]
MKKIITLIAIAFLSATVCAQETKPVAKEKAKKESCCAKKDSKSKAEGKKCDASMAKSNGKKC